jgi:DNA-binding NarL/FixJ family response regulator
VPGVLIADDNPSIRFLLRSFVEHQGFVVCGEASNGTDAIQKAKQLSPDLILLDLAMPVMTGAEASSILRGMLPQVRIVVFTLHAEGLGKALAQAIRADVVLSKQDGLNHLADHLKALLPKTVVPGGEATSTAPAPPVENPN